MAAKANNPPVLLYPTAPEDPPLPRNYLGWVALVVMFALVVANAIAGSIDRSQDARFNEFDDQLKSIVQAEQAKNRPIGALAALDSSDPAKDLRSLDKQLSKRKDLDKLGNAIYAAVLTEEKKPVPATIYQPLQKGTMDATRAMGAVYSSAKFTLPEARALARRLDSSSLFVAKLASIQAFEKAGDKTARARLLPKSSPASAAIVSLGLLGLMGGCIFCWFGYFAARANGELRPLGLLNGGISLAQADRFAVRAAQLFAGFLVIGLIGEIAFKSETLSPGPALLQSAAILVFVWLLAKAPLDTGKLSLAALGFSRENLGKHVVWGFAGFVAELPVAMLLSEIISFLLKFLPVPEHPATQELQQNHNLLTVFSILVLGTVVAPIWEEIMFRGLLFPALARVCKSIPIGAVASSLVFASIHPQGAALWLALGMTGLMGCALTYQTRSLVPSMVMHFFHNMTLMVLTILVS
jgi:membrane protease YdiL (CAAX protease family)